MEAKCISLLVRGNEFVLGFLTQVTWKDGH